MIWPAETLQNNLKDQTSWNIPSVKVHRARRIKSSRQVKFPFCHLLLVKGAALSSGSQMNKPASSVQALGIQTLTVLLDDPQSVRVWTYVYLYINLWLRVCVRECSFVCMPYEPLMCQDDCWRQLGTLDWAPMTIRNQILSLALSSMHTHLFLRVTLIPQTKEIHRLVYIHSSFRFRTRKKTTTLFFPGGCCYPWLHMKDLYPFSKNHSSNLWNMYKLKFSEQKSFKCQQFVKKPKPLTIIPPNIFKSRIKNEEQKAKKLCSLIDHNCFKKFLHFFLNILVIRCSNKFVFQGITMFSKNAAVKLVL